MQELTIQRIGGGTVYKLLLIGSIVTHVLISVIGIVGMLFGMFTAIEAGLPITSFNAELITLIYLVVGVLIMPLWAGVFWLGIYPGIWVYSKIKPMDIRYKDAQKNN